MTNGNSRAPPEALEEGIDKLFNKQLTPEQTIDLVKAVDKYLAPLAEFSARIFVTGSYHGQAGENVELTKEVLEILDYERNQNTRTLLMKDIPGEEVWINADLKFWLLGAISDTIVIVTEHDQGGSLIEQGIITRTESFRKKTHLLKRQYEDDHDHYSFMQSKGLFKKLSESQIHRWESIGEIVEYCRIIYEITQETI